MDERRRKSIKSNRQKKNTNRICAYINYTVLLEKVSIGNILNIFNLKYVNNKLEYNPQGYEKRTKNNKIEKNVDVFIQKFINVI